MEFFIRDHMRFLPGWDCIVFTCEQNSYLSTENVKLITLPSSRFDTYQKFERFKKSAWLWEQLTGYERVLTFEHDSKLLRTGIEEFLEWDYIGAPWGTKPCYMGLPVGNGGLSLRNPRVMLKIAKAWWTRKIQPEDLFFVMNMPKVGGQIAPREVAGKFACETLFQLGTLGCHAINKYLTPAQVKQVLSQYDESEDLRNAATHGGASS